MSLPQLQLDNQLCFLFHRIARELTAAYRPLLSGLGLTYPQYLVMLVLWESDGITVTAIGERLALDSATLSPLLRRLEAAGLVQRVRSERDERRVLVQLTAEGRDLQQQAAGVPDQLARRLVDSEAEFLQLHAALSALLQRVPLRAGGGT